MSSDRYEVIRAVLVGRGSEKQPVSLPGPCRYCGQADRSQFRKLAHAFPEALGNKWAFSEDECDRCNGTFSDYESSLVSSVAPFLSLGGVKGKRNRVRQTGRTAGPTYVRHTNEAGQRRISVVASEADVPAVRDDGSMRVTIPIASERFRPRHAYKALSKMGFSLLPRDELQNYEQLRRWLLDPDDESPIPVLEAALSFSMVGNAPEMVTGTLLRRCNPVDVVPHILFVLTAGSVCLQIGLRSDQKEAHIPYAEIGTNPTLSSKWRTTVRSADGSETESWQFSAPLSFNWTSFGLELQPVESVDLSVNLSTRAASFAPNFRNSALLLRPT